MASVISAMHLEAMNTGGSPLLAHLSLPLTTWMGRLHWTPRLPAGAAAGAGLFSSGGTGSAWGTVVAEY